MSVLDNWKEKIFGAAGEEEYEEAYEADDLSETINTAAAQNRPQAPSAGANALNPSFVLVRPERFDDSINIANFIIAGKTVVLNLEATGKDLSRRIIDILSGTAYAVGAQIKNVAVGTYLIIPGGADFAGDANNMVDTSSFSL